MTVREEKLGNLCFQIRGIAYGKDEIHELPLVDTIPLLRATNILESGEIDATDVLHVNAGCVNPKQILQKGDVLISASTGSKSSIGKPARVRGDDGVTFGAFCKALRPNTKLIDPDYFWFVFCRPEYRSYISNVVGGANINNIRNEHIDEFVIPLPPLATQKHIARVLEQADQLRKQAQQMESELNQLAQSLFLEMFGDPIENPKGWKKEPLQNLMTIKRGGSPRPIEKFVGGTIPWIKIGDATSGDDIYIYETKEKIIEAGLKKTVFLEPGSVIFANCGVSLGFARILKIHGCIHDGWLSFSEIDENRINKVFLLKAINSITEHFRRMAPEGTQPNLNTGLMKSFEMTVPPIDLQNSFEKLIFEISERKQEAKDKGEHFDLLFNSLMQRAFNGELTAPERKAA